MTKYKDFVKSTGYGTGRGLCGWNCRHSFIPFDPETMENNLKKYGLEENKKMYENHQKQRFFERSVRKYKKLAKLTKTALQKARSHEKSSLNRKYIHYKQLATKWNKEYQKFSKQNNLRVQIDRLKI